jgi:hypothetical protein
MSYLRFGPDDYQALCQLADQLPRGVSLHTLQHFLVAYLPLDRLELAQKIQRLDQRHLRLLYEHLKERSQAGGAEDRQGNFSAEELNVVAQACASFRHPVRFLRYYQDLLVEKLSHRHLALACKLARLSARQFARLCEQLQGRRNGSS